MRCAKWDFERLNGTDWESVDPAEIEIGEVFRIKGKPGGPSAEGYAKFIEAMRPDGYQEALEAAAKSPSATVSNLAAFDMSGDLCINERRTVDPRP